MSEGGMSGRMRIYTIVVPVIISVLLVTETYMFAKGLMSLSSFLLNIVMDFVIIGLVVSRVRRSKAGQDSE